MRIASPEHSGRRAVPEWAMLLVLLALAATLHGLWYARPLTVVFDEVYYAQYAINYLRHEDFYTLHPPFGRLLIYLAGWIAGVDPSYNFSSNGLPWPNDSYLALRFMPRLAGTLLPLVMFGLARELGLTRWTALVLGVLVALDNALLVVSRFALIDIFLVLAGFTALWCYLRARHGEAPGQAHGGGPSRMWLWLSFSALALGAAISTKWTGLTYVALVLGMELLRAFDRKRPDDARRRIGRLALLAIVPLLFYVATFAAHFALAQRTGPDDRIMSPSYQATLAGNVYAESPSWEKSGFVAKFRELNWKMFDIPRHDTSTHAYASKWFTWPFMQRPIDMWADYRDGLRAHIYMFGNPVVWWASACAVLGMLGSVVIGLGARASRAPSGPMTDGAASARTAHFRKVDLFLVSAWLMNLLPAIVVTRMMFLYHYFSALLFAMLALACVLDRLFARLPGRQRYGAGLALMLLAAGAFAYFAPLSYGLAITPEHLDSLFWFQRWR